MSHFHFSVSDNEGGMTCAVTFHAEDIHEVLDRFGKFLAAGEFPYVSEVVAVSHDENGIEDEDVYWYPDGTRLTGREIDELNEE